MHVCSIAAWTESVSKAKFGVCVHKEHWKHEDNHPCINVKLYFVVRKNLQQQEEEECERLRQHLIY